MLFAEAIKMFSKFLVKGVSLRAASPAVKKQHALAVKKNEAFEY